MRAIASSGLAGRVLRGVLAACLLAFVTACPRPLTLDTTPTPGEELLPF